MAAALTERCFGVDLALHDIEFAIDWRVSAFGLDQDEPIHTIGDVGILFCGTTFCGSSR